MSASTNYAGTDGSAWTSGAVTTLDLPPLPLIPHGNHILVVPVDPEPPKGIGGAALWLPVSARKLDPPQRAVVIGVGSGLADEAGGIAAAPCDVGDLIVHRKHAGTDVEWNGQTLSVIHWRDVWAVLRDDECPADAREAQAA